jgi:hypothetical protein
MSTGDFVFSKEFIEVVTRILNGYKKVYIVPGNHCFERVRHHKHTYLSLQHVELHALLKKHNIWFSHAPVTLSQLRGKPNAHGHVHHENEQDPLYINLCMESEFMKYDFKTKEDIFKCLQFRQTENFDMAKHVPNRFNQVASSETFQYQLEMIFSNPNTAQIYIKAYEDSINRDKTTLDKIEAAVDVSKICQLAKYFGKSIDSSTDERGVEFFLPLVEVNLKLHEVPADVNNTGSVLSGEGSDSPES